jgi:hypothetical protein
MMKNSFSLLPRASSRIFHPRSYVDYVRSGKNWRHSFSVLQMPILNPNYASRTTMIITPSPTNLDPVATKQISLISSFRLLTTTSYNAATNSSTVIQSRSSTSGGGRGGILPEVQTQVLDTCTDIHSSIMALNEKLRGPLPKNSVRPYCSSHSAAIYVDVYFRAKDPQILYFCFFFFSIILVIRTRIKVPHYPLFCLWGIIPVVNLPSSTIYFKGTYRQLEWHRRMIVSLLLLQDHTIRIVMGQR